MIKFQGVDHTSFTVSNLDRTLEFYVALLGFEIIWQREITNDYFRKIVALPDCVVKAVHLRIPGTSHKLELFEYVQPKGKPADIRDNNPGSSHLALLVDDIAGAYAYLKGKGVKFRSEPTLIDAGANKGGYGLYILDPDGISVELFQPAPKT
jgi:lactoylglutathione lyase